MLSHQVQEMAEISRKTKDLDPLFNAKKREQVDIKGLAVYFSPISK